MIADPAPVWSWTQSRSTDVDVEGLAKLREPFAPEQVGKLPATRKRPELDFVGHAIVTDRLLEVDPEWTWEPMGVDESGGPAIQRIPGRVNEEGVEVGGRYVMWLRLTVCGVTRPGVGTCPLDAFEPEKELVSDGLRNAAMRFGVALSLWAKEELEYERVTPDDVARERGWESHEAFEMSCADLKARSAALPEEHKESLRVLLKESGIRLAELTFTQYAAWDAALFDLEQAEGVSDE